MKNNESEKKTKHKDKELDHLTQSKILDWKMKHLQLLKQYHKTCPICDFMGLITRIDLKTLYEHSFKCPYCAVFINTPSGKDFGENKIVKGFDSLGGFYGLCNDVENWYTELFQVGVFQFYWDIRFGYGVNYLYCRNLILSARDEKTKMLENNINVPDNFMNKKKEEVDKIVRDGGLYKAVNHLNKTENLNLFIEGLKKSGEKHAVK